MSWQVIQSTTADTTFPSLGITTVVLTMSVPQNGNVLVMGTFGEGQAILPISNNVTWSLATSIITQYTTTSWLDMYLGVVNGVTGTGIAVTFAGGITGSPAVAVIAEISGQSKTSLIDIAQGINSSGINAMTITANSPIGTTLVSGDLIIALIAVITTGGTMTVNNAWSNSFTQTITGSDNGSTIIGLGMATYIATGTGSYFTNNTYTITGVSTSQFGAGIILGLQPLNLFNLVNRLGRRATITTFM